MLTKTWLFKDVDTIYMSHNSKELNLRDFDHLDPKYEYEEI